MDTFNLLPDAFHASVVTNNESKFPFVADLLLPGHNEKLCQTIFFSELAPKRHVKKYLFIFVGAVVFSCS